jgi:proteic killer suppression protein
MLHATHHQISRVIRSHSSPALTINKGVEEVFLTGRSRHIGAEFHKRMSLILDAIDAGTAVGDLVGARGFHALHGPRARTVAMSVSGNWRLTFGFEHGDKAEILDVDFEDYH